MSELRRDPSHRDVQSFGRRRARKLSARQQSFLDDTLTSRRALGADGAMTDLLRARIDHPETDVWLEIGFGGGEHFVWQAAANPGVTLVGCEPFIDGLVKALDAVEAQTLSNVLFHDDDVRPLLRALPDASLDRVFVLFPDPWPKKRHIKRRLVATPLLDELGRVMKPDAELRVGTDIADYSRTILKAVSTHPDFDWPVSGSHDWRIRPDDWPKTRYEAKADREGRRSSYFSFRRQTA